MVSGRVAGGGGHFGLPPVAHGASQRKQEQRVVDMGACKHRPILSDPVPQLALADAICLLPTLYVSRALLLYALCTNSCLAEIRAGSHFALDGNFSFVQGNLIWPAALPVILFAPDILRKVDRRNFTMAWVVPLRQFRRARQ